MALVRRLVLDVLKPHHPTVLEFGKILAEQGEYELKLTVIEKDDQTETLQVTITGEAIEFERLQVAITASGASLHSIDEVVVEGQSKTDASI